jgi:hypothetical protein
MASLTPFSFIKTLKVDNEGSVVESTTLIQRAQITANKEDWEICWYSEQKEDCVENYVVVNLLAEGKSQYYTFNIPNKESTDITWQEVFDVIHPDKPYRVVYEYVESSCNDIDSHIPDRKVYEDIVFQASIVCLE